MSRRYRDLDNLKKRCGCARRSWETCEHPWFFTLQWKGRVERGSLGVAKRDEAKIKLADIRAALMNGVYVAPRARVVAAPMVTDAPTFATVAKQYLTLYVEPKLSTKSVEGHHSIVRFLERLTIPPGVAFTDKPFKLVTTEDVEIAIAAKRERKRETVTKNGKTWTRAVGGDIAANRMQTHLAALWNWAIAPKRAYAEGSPFSFGGRVPEELKRPKEHGRERRLAPGEEDRLLAAAGPHLKDVIVCALEAGLRKTEILSLRWRNVRWLQNEIAVAWQNAKTKRAREIPISPRLREVLVRRQKAHPTDQPWTPEDFVFGDEIGRRVKDVKRAWAGAVLRANGVTVVQGKRGRVAREMQTKLAEIDLHFHDLRHEAGSRKLESGWPLHAVSRWLGHTKLTTTDTYLNATSQLLHELNERPTLALVK